MCHISISSTFFFFIHTFRIGFNSWKCLLWHYFCWFNLIATFISFGNTNLMRWKNDLLHIHIHIHKKPTYISFSNHFNLTKNGKWHQIAPKWQFLNATKFTFFHNLQCCIWICLISVSVFLLLTPRSCLRWINGNIYCYILLF